MLNLTRLENTGSGELDLQLRNQFLGMNENLGASELEGLGVCWMVFVGNFIKTSWLFSFWLQHAVEAGLSVNYVLQENECVESREITCIGSVQRNWCLTPLPLNFKRNNNRFQTGDMCNGSRLSSTL